VPAEAPVAEVIAWCFHSPRRLLVVVVTAVVVLLGGAAAIQAMRPGGNDGGAAGSSGVAVPVDSAPAVAAAVEFTRRWAGVPAGQDAAQWRAGLAGLVTPELAGGLALTDPASLPGGAPTGRPVVRFVSVSSALVEVPLSGSRSVLVTVVLANGHWLASDVQPLAGNAGDVGAGDVGTGDAGSGDVGPGGGVGATGSAGG
jgi:hypothetical protein